MREEGDRKSLAPLRAHTPATHTGATHTVFAVRMSAIGDTLIATRALHRLKKSGCEPVLVTSPGNADIARAMTFLRWYVTYDATSLFLYDKETGARLAPDAWPDFAGGKIALLDLHCTGRSRRAGRAVKQALARRNMRVAATHAVEKHTFARLWLLVCAWFLSTFRGQKPRADLGLAPLAGQNGVVELQRKSVDQVLKILGVSPSLSAPAPEMRASDDRAPEEYSVEKLLSAVPLGPLPVLDGETLVPGAYVCLVPGASGFVKQWPKESFRELARALAESKVKQVVVVGGPAETQLGAYLAHPTTLPHGHATRIVDATGRLSLASTVRVLEEARHVFCGDTFAAHVIDLTGTPGTEFYGSTSPALGFGPTSSNVTVLSAHLTCSPCTRHGLNTCRYSNLMCLKSLTFHDAMATLDRPRAR